MIPPILTEKIDKLHFPGLYLTLFLVSAFLYIDCFSLTFWNVAIEGLFHNLGIFRILVLLASYMVGIYFTILLRLLIVYAVNLLRPFNSEDRKEKLDLKMKYYTSEQLLEESLKENNNVKFQNHLRVEAASRQMLNIKIMSFAILLLIVWNSCLLYPVMRIIMEYKICCSFFAIAFLIGIFTMFSDDNHGIAMPLIKRDI